MQQGAKRAAPPVINEAINEALIKRSIFFLFLRVIFPVSVSLHHKDVHERTGKKYAKRGNGACRNSKDDNCQKGRGNGEKADSGKFVHGYHPFPFGTKPTVSSQRSSLRCIRKGAL